MIARPSHRLPATIASRCLRLALRPPPTAEAVAWLAGAKSPAREPWDAALALAGGAPLLALELDAPALAALDAEMQRSLAAIGALAPST